MFLAVLRAPSFLPQSLAGFLFENHWTWWAAAVLFATALLYLAWSRADRRLMRAGQIALAVAALWIVCALLIDTAAERLRTAHDDLADAVAQADLDRVFSFFDSDFAVPQLALRGRDLAAAKTHLAAVLKENSIKDTRITAFASAVHSDGTALSEFTALTVSSFGPIKTTWQLSWIDPPGEHWRIRHATLLKLGDQPFPVDALIR